MLLTVEAFCEAVQYGINDLIGVLAEQTARNVTDQEKKNMEASYKAVSIMFQQAIAVNPNFKYVNIGTSDMLLEYKLPSASAWCDLILLGQSRNQRKEVFIVELKNWQKNNNDAPGDFEGLIMHQGVPHQHPSDQVRGYSEYCQRFHSVVVESEAEVTGCVYFTQDIDLAPYQEGVNRGLTTFYPVYNTVPASTETLANRIADKIARADNAFAEDFQHGIYKQDRNILVQAAKNFRRHTADNRSIIDPFVLLDSQHEGFLRVLSIVDKLPKGQKEVIIVEGPPGSGKSAVATNIFVECAENYSDRGNIVFVTPTSSQNDNWTTMFDRNGGHGAQGFILRANDYNPGMNGAKMKDIYVPIFRKIDAHKYIDPNNPKSLKYQYFRDYVRYMLDHDMASRDYFANHHYISIVDEAHALINSAVEGFKTNKTAGWCFQMGPQAYHIIYTSQVSVFLMDGKQSFRDNESTTADDIEAYGKELGANVTRVSLEGMQFRCGGNPFVADWIDALFSDRPLRNAKMWKDDFDLHIVDYPSEMDEWLRSKRTSSIRLLSSYTREWLSNPGGSRQSPTCQVLNAMHTTKTPYDFVLKDKHGAKYRKYWNNPSSYDVFVQGSEGSKMHDDPLCEVGCPYAVRGFDYKYVGVLCLGDIVWRSGSWYIIFDLNKETATGSTKKAAVDEWKAYCKRKHYDSKRMILVPANHPDLPCCRALFKTIAEAYRIIMTRGVKGLCLYIEDEETKEHIKDLCR